MREAINYLPIFCDFEWKCSKNIGSSRNFKFSFLYRKYKIPKYKHKQIDILTYDSHSNLQLPMAGEKHKIKSKLNED